MRAGWNPSEFNPCDMWPTGSFGWRSLSVNVGYLTAGQLNSFDRREYSGPSSWRDRNTYFGVDQSGHPYDHTDARYDNTGVSGEIMWYLVIHRGGASSLATEPAAPAPMEPDWRTSEPHAVNMNRSR